MKPMTKDDEMMAADATLPPDQEMMDLEDTGETKGMAEGEMDDMDGYAEGNEIMPAATSTPADAAPMEKPALADVVPDANTNVEDRLAALENQLRSTRDAAAKSAVAALGVPSAPGGGMDSEWSQFKTDYPDIAGPIEKMLALRDQTRESQTAAMHTRIFEEAMDVARPDWRDLRDNPEFGAWMQANPDQQQAAQVPGVRAALKVLAAFDASRQTDEVSAKRKERLMANEATPAKGSRAPSLSDSLDGWAAA